MAVSFPGLDKSFYYTSDLQILDITADTAQVELRIYYQARTYYSGDGRTLVFQSQYYTRNDELTIFDVSSIIENYMQENGHSVSKFVFIAQAGSDTSEQAIECVYCKQRLLDPIAKTLLDDFFLTTHTNRLIPTNGEIQLPFYLEPGSVGSYATVGTTYTITYRDTNGSTHQATKTIFTRHGYGTQILSTSYQQIASHFSNNIPADAVILSVLIKTGNRKFRAYFTQQTNLHKFWFHNAFNCYDFAYLATKRIVKTKTKSSIASLCTDKAQYDVQHARSYTDTTSQLTHDEAVWLTEMLTSHYVAVEDDGDEEQILITDYKAETTDEQGEGNTLEFEWEYASVRFMLGKDQFTRIFTTEYDKPFA